MTSEALTEVMSLSAVHTAERNVFSCYLKVPSKSLSLTVFGKVFQMYKAENRKARLVKSVFTSKLQHLFT